MRDRSAKRRRPALDDSEASARMQAELGDEPRSQDRHKRPFGEKWQVECDIASRGEGRAAEWGWGEDDDRSRRKLRELVRAVLGGSWFVAGAVTGYLVPMAVATSAMPQHSEITLGAAICIHPLFG